MSGRTIPSSAPADSTSLAAVVVTHRCATLAERCVAALAPEILAAPDRVLAVVDSASGDGTSERVAAALRAHLPEDRFHLFESRENRGFAAANNAAIAAMERAGTVPEAYVLANPDTEVEPGGLDALACRARSKPEIGIVGGSLVSRDGSPQYAAFRFPSLLAEFAEGLRLPIGSPRLGNHMITHPMSSEAHPAQWVSGAFMLVKREVLDAVGPFDERYFLYFEEADLCRRAVSAGWRTWYEPAACAVHLGGASTGAMGPTDSAVARPKWWHDSRRRYFLKHHGRAYLAAADAARLCGIALWKLRCGLTRQVDPDPGTAYLDYLRNSVFVRGWRP